MISYIGVFAATYVTVQIVTFTECDPFDHYWTVLPDPGIFYPFARTFLPIEFSCSLNNLLLTRTTGICCQAQLQLIVLGMSPSGKGHITFRCNGSNVRNFLGVLNIITDLMLIVLPIPILVMVKRSGLE